MKNIISRKCLALCITLLFLCIVIRTVSTKQTQIRNTITVDDEQGDADYTSIKEAINNSNFGDTIEVYSGTYKEDDIIISTSNLTINGIPYELGNGNDTGKPIIEAINSKDCITLYGSNIIFTGFEIQIISNCGITVYSDDNTISENIIKTQGGVCILIKGTIFEGKRNAIIQNIFINSNSTYTYVVRLENATANAIAENDFLINTNAFFINSFRNRWILNYWQQPRFLPKLIFGKWIIDNEMFSGTIYWFNIDLYPALAPNNIT